MASRILVDCITIQNNPASFQDPICLKVTFTCLEALPHSLLWKIIYLGSAFSEDHDQILEVFEVGPIQNPSTMQFEVECEPPNPYRIPSQELLCVTALLITVSYQKQQFIRIGYYVDNDLAHDEQVSQTLELEDLLPSIRRTILIDKSRVTQFPINWDSNNKQCVKQS